MNIVSPSASRTKCVLLAPRRRREGTAMIVVLALLSIILVYMADNLKTLNHLGRELKLLEQRQLRRLQTTVGTNTTTNAPQNSVPLSPQSASPSTAR